MVLVASKIFFDSFEKSIEVNSFEKFIELMINSVGGKYVNSTTVPIKFV